MANIWEQAISILAGNLNSSLSYLITTVLELRNFLTILSLCLSLYLCPIAVRTVRTYLIIISYNFSWIPCFTFFVSKLHRYVFSTFVKHLLRNCMLHVYFMSSESISEQLEKQIIRRNFDLNSRIFQWSLPKTMTLLWDIHFCL